MPQFSFYPFTKDVENVVGQDLVVLKEVAEGWFVDYKREMIKPRELGKHLSAFANQQGGFLFIGVEEDKQTMKANAFPGVPTSSLSSVRVQLREATSNHIVPEVFFTIKVIEGPISELGLPADRSIVIVAIPESNNTPHIHSSGRIYRRVADQSDPKPETDRSVLDLLWGKRRRLAEATEEFLKDLPVLSKAESGPRAYAFFISDPSFSGRWTGITFRTFRRIMAEDEGTALTMKLRDVFPTTDGLIARDVERNDGQMETATFRWWHNGNARASIPLNIYLGLQRTRQHPPQAEVILEELQKRGQKACKLTDLSSLAAALAAMCSKYLALRKAANLTRPFLCKLHFKNIWRITPFLNLPSYLQSLEQNGVPVVQDDSCYCPPGLTVESLIALDESRVETTPVQPFVLILPLILSALVGVGVSTSFLMDADGQISASGIEELTSACIAAVQPPR